LQPIATNFSTQRRQTTQNRKEANKMAQKKVTKIKIRDLKPNKDAKGGFKIVYAPGGNK
jgi:hypothetical protein